MVGSETSMCWHLFQTIVTSYTSLYRNPLASKKLECPLPGLLAVQHLVPFCWLHHSRRSETFQGGEWAWQETLEAFIGGSLEVVGSKEEENVVVTI